MQPLNRPKWIHPGWSGLLMGIDHKRAYVQDPSVSRGVENQARNPNSFEELQISKHPESTYLCN